MLDWNRYRENLSGFISLSVHSVPSFSLPAHVWPPLFSKSTVHVQVAMWKIIVDRLPPHPPRDEF